MDKLELDGFDEFELFQDLADVKEEACIDADQSPASNSHNFFDWENENFEWAMIPSTVDLADSNEEELNQAAVPLYMVQSVNDIAEPSVPSPDSRRSSEDLDVASKTHLDLMLKYDLTDSSLSDSTIKALKRLCGSNVEDFDKLKGYRRTCLNRHYARSSRNKQQEKTTGLSTELRAAQLEIRKLRKDVEERDTRIKYLELENRLLLDLK